MSSPPTPPGDETRREAGAFLAGRGRRIVGEGNAPPTGEDLAAAVEEETARLRFPRRLRTLAGRLYRHGERSGGGERRGRHRFIVVIPVADRPRLIRDCLEDLLAECRTFRYPFVTALMLEDGADEGARAANRDLARELAAAGLPCAYWGLEEQENCLAALPRRLRRSLSGLGAAARTVVGPHRGASAVRNLASLVLAATLQDPRTLIWFVDSDEAWQVRILGEDGGAEDLRGFSFFHRMNALFSGGGRDIVTAHVVGDPPVSPAVMAGSFSEDLLATLERVSGRSPEDRCPFHGRHRSAEGHDAAYHDFAALFGYPPQSRSEGYACGIRGGHDLGAGLGAYGKALNGFFFGHHPSRQTLYHPGEALGAAVPARTVYTGNVVVGPGAREAFIPFADLGLRMAGPVWGRILRQRHGARFVKANLPLLHRRTLAGLSAGEYRAGVTVGADAVPDLGPEFSRQFWGDVLLFAVEELCERGFPASLSSPRVVKETIRAQRARLGERYGARTERMEGLLRRLGEAEEDLIRRGPAVPGLRESLARCVRTLDANFSSRAPAVRDLNDRCIDENRISRLVESVNGFIGQEELWTEAVDALKKGGPAVALPPDVAAGGQPEPSGCH